MRYASEIFEKEMPESRRSYQRLLKDKPIVPGFNTEDLAPTPELPPANLRNQINQERYIRHGPGGGIALLPGGVQGPAQGPNIPIKRYGDKYMPDGTQPSGYRPTPNGFV